MSKFRARSLLLPLIVAFGLTACGGDSASSGVVLTADGELGRKVARGNGCAACHGANGEGTVGPAFVGLYGSTVTFDDGSTTMADDAYLRESILEPSARRVEGFNLPMPENDLSDEQVEQLIAYIRDLSAPVSAP
ncbi:MAG TPA: cytochrome c [Ilumatobacter sp.]|nr:cytochrome c [Ilumatobacter sp.]